jgi:hypothetical protein
MYVTRVEIENIKCFRRLVWEIDAGAAPGGTLFWGIMDLENRLLYGLLPYALLKKMILVC